MRDLKRELSKRFVDSSGFNRLFLNISLGFLYPMNINKLYYEEEFQVKKVWLGVGPWEDSSNDWIGENNI